MFIETIGGHAVAIDVGERRCTGCYDWEYVARLGEDLVAARNSHQALSTERRALEEARHHFALRVGVKLE